MSQPTPAGTLTLAKGRRKIALLKDSDVPASWAAITTEEAAKLIDLSCIVSKADFSLGWDESDTVDDGPLCSTSNQKPLDSDNFSAAFSLFRYLNEADGAPGTNDVAWPILSTKGNIVWLLERESPIPLATVDWADGDAGTAFPFVVDRPGWPSDLTGNLKRTIRVQPQGDPVAFAMALS